MHQNPESSSDTTISTRTTDPTPSRVRIGRKDLRPDLEAALYREGHGPVAGVDEAGRGACAGPLVVASVILGPEISPELAKLDDSKKLRPAVREALSAVIQNEALAWNIVFVEVSDIDAEGVHHHNIDGMRRAVAGLGAPAGYVLTDGYEVPGFAAPSLGVVGGDASVPSIAAASVLAKVARDRFMVDLDTRCTGYGFAGHKGYGTAAHQEAIARLGPSPQHRMSYANVQRAAEAHRLREPKESR